MSVADELAKLNALREQGVLTDEEFESQKAKLLSEGHAAEASQPAQVEAPSAAAPAASASAPPSTKGSGVLPKVLIALLLLGAVGVLVYFLLGGGSSEAGKVLKRMPADSMVAFAVDLSTFTEDPAVEKNIETIKGLVAVTPKGAQIAALLEAMPVSSLKTTACSFFGPRDNDFACLLKGEFNTEEAAPIIADLLGLKSGDDFGGKTGWSNGKNKNANLSLVIYDDETLMTGKKHLISKVIDALDGKGDTIGDSKNFANALDHVNSGATMVLVGGMVDEGHGAVSLDLDGKIDIQAVGFAQNDKFKSKLDKLAGAFEGQKQEILAKLAKDGAKIPKEMSTFITPYMKVAKELVESSALEEVDDGLKFTASSELPEGGLIGDSAVMSAVAIPAFIKYMRRAKTTEAIDQLDKIYKGASVYYSTPHVLNTGQKVPCQFPRNQVCIPAGSPCDYPDKKYPADPSIWDTPTWSALSFAMYDSHYFKYCFDAEGTLSDANFRATAHADLDCDGNWSTFQRIAFGDEQANFAECALHGAPAMYVDQETE